MIKSLLIFALLAYFIYDTYEETILNDADFVMIEGVSYNFKYDELRGCKVWNNDNSSGACCTLMKGLNNDNAAIKIQEK